MYGSRAVHYENVSSTELVNLVPFQDESGGSVENVKVVYSFTPPELGFFKVSECFRVRILEGMPWSRN